MTQTQVIRGVATTVNTTPDGITHVTYHNTDVVCWDDKQITLNSDGWQSATTKTRMNQASNQFNLGYQVYQKNREWFVDYRGETVVFYDGMKLKR